MPHRLVVNVYLDWTPSATCSLSFHSISVRHTNSAARINAMLPANAVIVVDIDGMLSLGDAVKMSVNFHEWQTIVDLKLLPNKITIKSNLYHRRLTATDALFSPSILNSHLYFIYVDSYHETIHW